MMLSLSGDKNEKCHAFPFGSRRRIIESLTLRFARVICLPAQKYQKTVQTDKRIRQIPEKENH